MKKIQLLVAISLVVFSLPALAGFDEGEAAYQKQDYAAALKEWQPLAEQNEARAQHQLGSKRRLG
jgi:TPR repeat protein